VPGRVPQLPAGAGMAGPAQPGAAGGPYPRLFPEQHPRGAAGDPPGPAFRPALARGGQGRREGGVPGGAWRPVRGVPRVGAVPAHAALGDGRGAGGDHPAVGAGVRAHRARVAGTAGRAPGEALLQRAALGP
jgi:hypothetical protein